MEDYWSLVTGRSNNREFANFWSYSWPVLCALRWLCESKMKSLVLAVVSLLAISSINCEVFFEEKFPDGKLVYFIQKSNFWSVPACRVCHRSIPSLLVAGLFWGYYVKIVCIFISDSWESNWVYSEHPGKEFGKFKLTAGKFYNDPEEDKGRWRRIHSNDATSHLQTAWHTLSFTISISVTNPLTCLYYVVIYCLVNCSILGRQGALNSQSPKAGGRNWIYFNF